MCILARSLPYLPTDKLLDLSVWRGVVFTGLWVCKVLVAGIWVVPGRGGMAWLPIFGGTGMSK